MQITKANHGFTLIEMLVVLAIIAILSVMMLPSPESGLTRRQVAESIGLIESYQNLVVTQYGMIEQFPPDNESLGIPKPELLIGNYVTKIELQQGAFHIYFGNKSNLTIQDKVLSLRPIVVSGSPSSPMSWVCGNSTIPEGMKAVGENKTSIEPKYLPLSCR